MMDAPWNERRAMINFKSLTNGEACYVEAVKPPSDSINHPDHYNTGRIEVIEAIEDWKLNYHLGNAVKYIARAGKKDPAKLVEDLEKAIWYVRRRIELELSVPRRPNDMPQERLK